MPTGGINVKNLTDYLDFKKIIACVGSLIEMMKNPERGTNGHICIQTNYLDRAIYHLEKRGFVFDESSFKYNDNGELTVAYLKDEIAGLSVHFKQK